MSNQTPTLAWHPSWHKLICNDGHVAWCCDCRATIIFAPIFVPRRPQTGGGS